MTLHFDPRFKWGGGICRNFPLFSLCAGKHSRNYNGSMERFYISPNISAGEVYVFVIQSKYTTAKEMLENRLMTCSTGKDVHLGVSKGFEFQETQRFEAER